MTFYGIEIRTLTDKIAELLLQGTNIGIIERIKLLNNKKISKEVKDLIQEFVNMQENTIEYLKKYL